MKIGLIFPPQWCPTHPYLSNPSLAAFLIENGFEVNQKDLNIEFYSYVLRPEFLHERAKKLTQRFKELDTAEYLAPELQTEYMSLFDILSDHQTVCGQISQALLEIRSGDFFNFTSLKKNLWLIERALKLVSLSYEKTELTLTSFSCQFSEYSLSDIQNAISGEQEDLMRSVLPVLLKPWLETFTPTLIGISITGVSQIIPALVAGAWIKKQYPHVHIVVGGSIITRWASEYNQLAPLFHQCFDSLIVFEGERPLTMLARALENKESFKTVPNLIYFENNSISVNSVEKPLDIDSLPTPVFDDLPFKQYLSPFLVLPILTSRGCYWNKCTFCDHSFIYGNRYSVRSVQNVASDLKKLSYRYKTRYFAFSDEAVAPERMRQLCIEIQKQKLNLAYVTAIRFESAFEDDELVESMKASGLKAVFVGFESGSEITLSAMRKGTSPDKIQKIINKLSKVGIWVHLFVMLGFPTETDDDYLATEVFIRNNRSSINSLGASTFGLCRYSYVCRHPDDFHIIIKDDTSITLPIFYPFQSNFIPETSIKDRSKRFEMMIQEVFPDHQIWRSLERGHLLLFLDRFSTGEIQNLDIIRKTAQYSRGEGYLLNPFVSITHTHFDLTSADYQTPLSRGDFVMVFNTKNGVLLNLQESLVSAIEQVLKDADDEVLDRWFEDNFNIERVDAVKLTTELINSLLDDQILIKN